MTDRLDQLHGGHAPADAGGAFAAGGVSSLNLPPPAPAGGGPFQVKGEIFWPVSANAETSLGALGRRGTMSVVYDQDSGRIVEVRLSGDCGGCGLDALGADISRRLQAGAALFDLATTIQLVQLARHLSPEGDAPRFPFVIVVEAVIHRLIQIEGHLTWWRRWM